MTDLAATAWSDFCRTLEAAGQVVLRDSAPDTPLDRAEGFRYLSRLTRGMLYSCVENSDPDRPRLQELDLVKVGADNPDNVYLSAAIRGDREYRIRGTRGSIAYLSFASKANRYAVDGTMASTGELAGADLEWGADDEVEIVVSSTQPHSGNWLPLAPDSTSIIIRQTYLDRASETPGRWSIEKCVDEGPPVALTPETLARALAQAARGVKMTATTFARWTELFMTRPNELVDFGQEMFQRAGGDPQIHYLHGYWTLRPDDAWVIRTEVPECTYWNFQLDNWWMESLDHQRRITVNKHTAELDDDGRLTIVVAATDPGVGSWIDTADHSSGTALLRWLGAEKHPIPACEVVPLASLTGRRPQGVR